MMEKRSERRNAEQWQALVNEFKAATESDSEFCRLRGLGLSSFRKWRRHLNRLGSGPLQPIRRPGFVKVMAPTRPAMQEVVTLHLDAMRIEVPASLGFESIALLARAIRDGR
jgi:hypothetical protein